MEMAGFPACSVLRGPIAVQVTRAAKPARATVERFRERLAVTAFLALFRDLKFPTRALFLLAAQIVVQLWRDQHPLAIAAPHFAW
jgi:hypothetical protein